MPVPSADIESRANEPTLVILLSPKETLPLNVPPFAEETVSLGENADKATTSTTSLAVNAESPVIVLPLVA